MVVVDECDNDEIAHRMSKSMLIHSMNPNEPEKYFLYEVLFVVCCQV